MFEVSRHSRTIPNTTHESNQATQSQLKTSDILSYVIMHLMEFYHVLNRGVEKRDIVLDEGDRMRFVQSLYVFNDSNPAPNGITQRKKWNNRGRSRDCLVRLHAWCLMDNHYHLFLSPVRGEISNISLFMKKLNGGYAKFFNEKYQRAGCLWQGKFKKVKIERDNQFMYIPYYIHLNPLDIQYKDWREGKLNDLKTAINYLDGYRWSSWQDYTGVKNFPSILDQSILNGILASKINQINEIEKIVSISNKLEIANLEHFET